MTPADWHASADPLALVRHLRGRPKLSRWVRWAVGLPAPLPERKLRQLLEAVCDLPPADADEDRLFMLRAVRDALPDAAALDLLAQAFSQVAGLTALVPEQLALFLLADDRHNPPLAAAVRCLFGDPFQPVPAVTPWRTRDVVLVAQAAAVDFSRLPVLADALEDAGCDHAGVLAHLRGPGPHRPGCHALATVLGGSL